MAMVYQYQPCGTYYTHLRESEHTIKQLPTMPPRQKLDTMADPRHSSMNSFLKHFVQMIQLVEWPGQPRQINLSIWNPQKDGPQTPRICTYAVATVPQFKRYVT